MNSSSPRVFANPAVIGWLVAGWFFIAPAIQPAVADDFAHHNNEANDLVEKGMLDEALRKYEEAEIERPDAPEIDYNIGNVYHLKEQYDTAAVQYQDAVSTLSGPLAPNAFYNLGNTLFRMEQYGPAVEAYKRALIENPDDQDAKYNLELALRRLQADSTAQQQQNNQDQDQKQQPDSSSHKQEQNQHQDQDSTAQQQSNRSNEPQPDSAAGQPPPGESEEQQQAQQEPQEAPPPTGMTKEDAERLLDALKARELDVQKLRAQRVATPARVAKDW